MNASKSSSLAAPIDPATRTRRASGLLELRHAPEHAVHVRNKWWHRWRVPDDAGRYCLRSPISTANLAEERRGIREIHGTVALPQPVPPPTSATKPRWFRAVGCFAVTGRFQESKSGSQKCPAWEKGRPAVGIAAGSETRRAASGWKFPGFGTSSGNENALRGGDPLPKMAFQKAACFVYRMI